MFDPSGVADLANTAIGTGPYDIKAWNRGQSIELAARDGYWGDKPKVKNGYPALLRRRRRHHQRAATGDVDVVYNMQAPELLSSFKTDPKYQVLDGTSNGEIVLSMNNKVAPFNDVRVRKAVMYAIDRKAVVDTAWSGYGTVIGAAVPPTDPYYEDLNGLYPHDPAKAKELLKEAGAENLDDHLHRPDPPLCHRGVRDSGLPARGSRHQGEDRVRRVPGRLAGQGVHQSQLPDVRGARRGKP